MKKCFFEVFNILCLNLFLVLIYAAMVSFNIIDIEYMHSWFSKTTLVVFLIGWSAIWLCMAASTFKRHLKKQ